MRTKWYWVFAVLFLMFFAVGCSALKQTVSAYDACKNDPACYAQMEQGRDLVSSIATSASSAVPQTAPIAQIIGSNAGMLASLLLGVYLGRKKER